MKKIREAVSLIFECDGEVFSIVRQDFLRAFPGYTAFIGGKVDHEDNDDGVFNLHILDQHPRYLMNALVRETKEEVGIEIDRLVEKGQVTAVDFIGRAVSPKFNPYRFNTYFYRVSFDSKPDFRVDENEVKTSKWSSPSQVMQEWKRGESMMVPPVRYFFEALSENIHFKDEINFENRFDLEKMVPWIESIHGLVQVMPLSNTVPPAERTNAFVIGDKEKILIDPSPKNQEELTKFLATIKEFNIQKIFITHHHKDHHQFATKIARDLKCKILMSQYTLKRCQNVYGDDYFNHIETTIVKEGDVLTEWIGEEIVIVEVPGHDEGQLAIMPTSAKWFLAGDLFQGVGTVVVGGEEGCMTKYFATLQKVIGLKPACVIPSHGIALGGTHILEKTYEHRVYREKQILEMFNEGLSVDGMLKRIYFNIPEKVLKYAKANIQSHLKKLKLEGQI